jgi:hypothetical protein
MTKACFGMAFSTNKRKKKKQKNRGKKKLCARELSEDWRNFCILVIQL